MVLIIVIVLLVFIVLVYMLTYNRLVSLREQFRNAWSQIDVQLKRRHDLIPNLVETVKGYAAHERERWKRSCRRANRPSMPNRFRTRNRRKIC